jgi:hypothetical protein
MDDKRKKVKKIFTFQTIDDFSGAKKKYFIKLKIFAFFVIKQLGLKLDLERFRKKPLSFSTDNWQKVCYLILYKFTPDPDHLSVSTYLIRVRFLCRMQPLFSKLY